MKKFLVFILTMFIVSTYSYSQNMSGKCNNEVGWKFDGVTLRIFKTDANSYEVAIPDYNMNDNLAPWIKQNLKIKKVIIGKYINRVGSCAFANCKDLEIVEFESNTWIKEIGFCAFYKCEKLFTLYMPINLTRIEKLAFAYCSSLNSISIQGTTTVDEQAFRSCNSLNSLNLSPGVKLGKHVFILENNDGGEKSFRGYNGQIKGLPANVNSVNALEYGLDVDVVKIYLSQANAANINENNVDVVTSDVDVNIPVSDITRANTYALIIGNEAYRFAPHVPFAQHDATVFSEYCKITLGIPTDNVHLCLNATKHMLQDQEVKDWLGNIPNRQSKSLIVYYSGHGVPDYTDNNKSYLLPVDVNSRQPKYGISLDDFYDELNLLGFDQTTVFIDACFSGIGRDDNSVSNEKSGGVDVVFNSPKSGNMVVFSAAQGTETAHVYQEAGHGLFTYHLLKEIQNSRGNVNYGKLSDNIQRNVSNKSQNIQTIRKKQTPTTISSRNGRSWRNYYFK